jgi:hypothetical protein
VRASWLSPRGAGSTSTTPTRTEAGERSPAFIVAPDLFELIVRIFWPGEVISEGGTDLADVAYVSRVKVEPVEGMIRRAHLPAEEEPVLFGAHSEVAELYGISPAHEEQHSSTFDYLVAAAGG